MPIATNPKLDEQIIIKVPASLKARFFKIRDQKHHNASAVLRGAIERYVKSGGKVA